MGLVTHANGEEDITKVKQTNNIRGGGEDGDTWQKGLRVGHMSSWVWWMHPRVEEMKLM